VKALGEDEDERDREDHASDQVVQECGVHSFLYAD
jgi:hypothetical protein